jgi:hypothetical protein
MQHLEQLNVQSFAACETSVLSNGSFPATTMTSADFFFVLKNDEDLPW